MPAMAPSHVLIVDDNAELRSALGDTLRDSGFGVSAAADGAAALREIAGGQRPDVVLVDLLMPGMDGTEFLEQLRATPGSQGIRVVVITGLASSHVKRLLKADAYLFKPFTPAELTSLVRRLGERDS